MRAAAAILAALTLLGTIACDATPPTAPTSVPLTSLKVLYESSFGPASIGNLFRVYAFSVDADGVYTDVSNLAQWTTSDANVFRMDPFFSSPYVAGVRAGSADVIATYQGLSGSLNAVYGGLSQPLPRIMILSGDPRDVGQTSTAFAIIYRSDGTLANISANGGVVWTSSNPEVATVNGGRVTAVAVGTTQITATYDGVSSWYRFSVFPRRSGRAAP